MAPHIAKFAASKPDLPATPDFFLEGRAEKAVGDRENGHFAVHVVGQAVNAGGVR